MLFKKGDSIRITKHSDDFCCHQIPVGSEVVIDFTGVRYGMGFWHGVHAYAIRSDSIPNLLPCKWPGSHRFVCESYCELVKASEPAKPELFIKHKTSKTMEFKIVVGATPEVLEVLSAIAASLSALAGSQGAPVTSLEAETTGKRTRRTKAEIEAEKALNTAPAATAPAPAPAPAATAPASDPFAANIAAAPAVSVDPFAATSAPAAPVTDPFAAAPLQAAPAVSLETVRAKATEIALANGGAKREAVLALMGKFGVSAMTDLPAEKAAAFYAELEVIAK